MFWHVSVLPSVCPQGAYPYPIMLCNISQNATGQTGGGYPARSSRGVPCWGVFCWRGYPAWGVPCWGVPLRGVPCWGVPWSGTPPARSGQGGTLPGGGNQVGQQKEYSIHGGQYASCIHAGGLSCLTKLLPKTAWKKLDQGKRASLAWRRRHLSSSTARYLVIQQRIHYWLNAGRQLIIDQHFGWLNVMSFF